MRQHERTVLEIEEVYSEREFFSSGRRGKKVCEGGLLCTETLPHLLTHGHEWHKMEHDFHFPVNRNMFVYMYLCVCVHVCV